MFELIYKIDLFGKNYSLEEKDSQKFNTLLGLVFTVITILASLTVALIFGKEIYEKKHPQVTYSDKSNPNSKVFLDDFPIIFQVSDSEGNNVPFEHFFDVKVTKYSLENGIQHTHLPEYEKCDFDKIFKNHEEIRKEVELSTKNWDFYCLNTHQPYVQNILGSGNSTTLTISAGFCLDNEGKNLDQCNQINPYNEYLINNMFFQIFIFNTVVDPSNFKNPVQYDLNNIIQHSFNTKMLKMNYLNLYNYQIQTDEGWLFENNKIFNYIQAVEGLSDSNLAENGQFLWVVIQSPETTTIINRHYMKIQDLFAKIGGFFNGLVIFFHILTINYVNFKY